MKNTGSSINLIDEFKPTKLHQDVMKIIEAESENNQNLIKLIYKKTQDIIQKLQQLKQQMDNELTLEKLKELKQQADLERFLYHIVCSF